MPLVRIEIIKGKDREYKKAIADCVHEGLMEAFGISDDDRFQRIIEIYDEDFERSSDKTDKFTMIELTIFPGRTKEQKAAAIRMITEKLTERLSIPATDVFIIMHELPLENWGFAGHQK